MTLDELAQLRQPFPKGSVGKLPRNVKKADGSTYTIQLDYIGHALVTDRLLTVDPNWTYEPMARTELGEVILDDQNGLWINLTVLGVTRPGYGYAINNPHFKSEKPRGDLIKEAIGDAIRNAAMRFGVALDLWSKDELESQIDKPELKNDKPRPPRPSQATLKKIDDVLVSKEIPIEQRMNLVIAIIGKTSTEMSPLDAEKLLDEVTRVDAEILQNLAAGEPF